MKLPKTLQKLNKDPRIEKIFIEDNPGVRNNKDYWIWLKKGFADLKFDPRQPTHTIHEWTVKDILARMRGVGDCPCADCRNKIKIQHLPVFEKWQNRMIELKG